MALGGRDLSAWTGLRPLRPLAGGARSEVALAERSGQYLVVRRSRRPAPALDWELDLLAFLGERGIGVPATAPADDGRRHVGGVWVQEYVPGRPPASADDWAAALRLLARLHVLTAGWPQRPGFASARELLTVDRGGDVRLDLMPAAAVAEVRDAWRPVLGGPECVNHGDVGPGNIIVADRGIVLVDWDESRVDVPWFDVAFLPAEVEPGYPGDRRVLEVAGVAWEVANGWAPEPEYAARRLAELRARPAR
jgi:Ser/Thr protein kinase RdoA (MazF antagonist)